MKLGDGALRLFRAEHFQKPVAFGSMGVAVVDDLNAVNRTDAFKQVLEVLFTCIVG